MTLSATLAYLTYLIFIEYYDQQQASYRKEETLFKGA